MFFLILCDWIVEYLQILFTEIIYMYVWKLKTTCKLWFFCLELYWFIIWNSGIRLIFRQSHRQHTWCARDFKISFIYFKFTDQTFKYTLWKVIQNTVSIYLIFFFSQFYAKGSDYRAVGLSIRTRNSGIKLMFFLAYYN